MSMLLSEITMRKIKIDDGTIRANDIKLERIELVTDSASPNKIEIYILDDEGDRIEGGTFDADAFASLVRKFYDAHF